MQIILNINEIKHKINSQVGAVALGTFDGIHIGHETIINQAVELARNCGKKSVVFTFSNHPLSVLAPAKQPKQLGDYITKPYLIERLGVDFLVNIPFNEELADWSPREFMQFLRDSMAPEYVVVGPNYSFGSKGRGNPDMLLQEGKRYGFQAKIANAVERDGKIVSSTRIRTLIDDGDLETANEYLGHPFMFAGKVIHGDSRGHTIGFPTANMGITEIRSMLPNGAYAVLVVSKGKKYMGIASIGHNPTFDGNDRRVEVHILDFSEDIYGAPLMVEFHHMLRPQMKFSGVAELVAQLKQDEMSARKLLKNKEKSLDKLF